jgi:hypothetical protein
MCAVHCALVDVGVVTIGDIINAQMLTMENTELN